MDIEEFKTLLKRRYKMDESELSDRPEDLLNGDIILVLGNHDKKPKQYYNRNIEIINGFYHFTGDILNKVQHPDPMLSGFIKEMNGTKYMFSHYDIFTTDEWDRKNKMIAPRMKVLETIFKTFDCDKLVHGHVHSLHSARKKDINVCFEHLDFRPQKLSKYLV